MNIIIGLACMAASTEASFGFWSDEETWKDTLGHVPKEGDEVYIMAEQTVIYDLDPEESVILKSLEVDGILEFERGTPAILESQSIWIRAGEVRVGTEEEPFDSTVEIRLHGNEVSPSEFVFDSQLPVGKENMIVTGKLNMFGAPRHRMTRLLDSAYRGSSTLTVDTGLDFVEGDKLGLPATNDQMYNSETVTVKSYDTNSGKVILTEPLKGYHFGQEYSTEDQYSTAQYYYDPFAFGYEGVDMRGEVLLLSSNVKIISSTESESDDQPRPYGCGILVSDLIEDGSAYSVGRINLDNIALSDCIQEATDQAAIKFHNANGGVKIVTNSGISSGLGMGIDIFNSTDVTLDGNVIHDFTTWGIHAEESQNLVIKNNIINGIETENRYGGGLYLGTSTSFIVTDNIVASTSHTGFMLPAYQCGGTQVHFGNLAHSIDGYGVNVLKAETTNDCLEFSHFKGYKTRRAVVHMAGDLGAHTHKVSEIFAIDAATGLMAFLPNSGHVEVSNSIFYGDQDINFDCEIDEGEYFQPISKHGLMIPVFGKDDMFDEMLYERESWGGSSSMRNIKFIGYDRKTTVCEGEQAAIVTNDRVTDYHPPATFWGTLFTQVTREAMFLFKQPRQEQANPLWCGEFTCSGLYNVLVQMHNTGYQDSEDAFGQNFQVTLDNKESWTVEVVDHCEPVYDWNAWVCQYYQTALGLLLFESQDDDRMDRSPQTVIIHDDQPQFVNRMIANSTTQLFSTIIDQSRNYTIVYNSTPPKKQKFSRYGGWEGTLITIEYPDAGAYQIYNEAQELVPPTIYDHSTELTGQFGCGENRYTNNGNILQFWIEPECTLFIYPRYSIKLSIRVDTEFDADFDADFEEFQKDSYTNWMAAALEIQEADLKVEPVKMINFEISAPHDDEEPMTTLRSLEDKFIDTAPMWARFGEMFQPAFFVEQIVTSDGETINMDGYADL